MSISDTPPSAPSRPGRDGDVVPVAVGMKVLAWIGWSTGFLLIGGVAFLWWVFGLGAAQGADGAGEVAFSSGILLAVILLASLWAMIKAKYLWGIAIIWAIPFFVLFYARL